jgi:hypothetical protein
MLQADGNLIIDSVATGDRLNIQKNPPPADLDIESRRLSASAVSKGLSIYIVTFLVLTIVAWCAFGIGGYTLHGSYQHPSMLAPEPPFGDFNGPGERVGHFGEPHLLTRTDLYAHDPYPYPVPSIYAYLFFLRLFHHPLRAYLVFALLSFFIPACLFSLRVKRMGAGRLPQIALWSTLLLGFPLLILLDRGNIEAVLWVFILLGIVAYTRNRSFACAISWAIAASMKIMPGLFFLLFLAKRKYWMFVLAIVATVTFAMLALAGIGPTIRQAATDSAKSASFLRNDFILARHGPEFDESLFGATKQVISLYDYGHRSSYRPFPNILPGMERALRLYNIFVPIVAVLLYWFRLRHLPLMNQFIAYVVLSILLPQVSYEYKLVYMYLVWGAFLLFLLADVATDRVKIPARTIHTVLLSCAVIFVPLTYLQVSNSRGHPFGVGGQVKMAFLVLIFWTILKVPMPSSLFGDLETLSSGSGDLMDVERAASSSCIEEH